jgi:hypothetical protein
MKVTAQGGWVGKIRAPVVLQSIPILIPASPFRMWGIVALNQLLRIGASSLASRLDCLFGRRGEQRCRVPTADRDRARGDLTRTEAVHDMLLLLRAASYV